MRVLRILSPTVLVNARVPLVFVVCRLCGHESPEPLETTFWLFVRTVVGRRRRDGDGATPSQSEPMATRPRRPESLM